MGVLVEPDDLMGLSKHCIVKLLPKISLRGIF